MLHLILPWVQYCNFSEDLSWVYISEILPEKGVFLITGIHWILVLGINQVQSLINFKYYAFIIFAIFEGFV